MGVTVECKKTGRCMDMGYGGFLRLRCKVAELAGGEFYDHYKTLHNPNVFLLSGKERTCFFDAFNEKTEEILAQHKADEKIVDFLLQSDCGGQIRYGACKNILKVIGDYDDTIIYGYRNAMFRDFKSILQECVDCKCNLVWR